GLSRPLAKSETFRFTRVAMKVPPSLSGASSGPSIVRGQVQPCLATRYDTADSASSASTMRRLVMYAENLIAAMIPPQHGHGKRRSCALDGAFYPGRRARC